MIQCTVLLLVCTIWDTLQLKLSQEGLFAYASRQDSWTQYQLTAQRVLHLFHNKSKDSVELVYLHQCTRYHCSTIGPTHPAVFLLLLNCLSQYRTVLGLKYEHPAKCHWFSCCGCATGRIAFHSFSCEGLSTIDVQVTAWTGFWDRSLLSVNQNFYTTLIEMYIKLVALNLLASGHLGHIVMFIHKTRLHYFSFVSPQAWILINRDQICTRRLVLNCYSNINIKIWSFTSISWCRLVFSSLPKHPDMNVLFQAADCPLGISHYPNTVWTVSQAWLKTWEQIRFLSGYF